MKNMVFFSEEGNQYHYDMSDSALYKEMPYHYFSDVPIGAVGWWGADGFYKLSEDILIARNDFGHYTIYNRSTIENLPENPFEQEHTVWYVEVGA